MMNISIFLVLIILLFDLVNKNESFLDNVGFDQFKHSFCLVLYPPHLVPLNLAGRINLDNLLTRLVRIHYNLV
jgi:hypothetical protein